MHRALLGAASAALLVHGAEVPCAAVDQLYNDSSITAPPSYLADAVACQALCKASPTCKVFTFYKNSGGCWLQSEQAVLQENKVVNQSVAGPKECNSTKVISDAVSGSMQAKEAALGASGDSLGGNADSGGFPLWGWLAGGAVVALGAGATGMYVMDSEPSKKKVKGSSKRGVKVDTSAQNPVQQAKAPGGALPAGLPQLTPVPSISQPVMTAPAQGQPGAQFAPQYYAQQQPYAQIPQGYESEMQAAQLTGQGYPNFNSFGALPAGAVPAAPAQYMPVQQGGRFYQQGYEQA